MTQMQDGPAASDRPTVKWWRSMLRDAAAKVADRGPDQTGGISWYPDAVLNASAAQRAGTGPDELLYLPHAVSEVSRGFAEGLSRDSYEHWAPIQDQIDHGRLMTTLATGPVDETLDRAANLIAEAADRADGRLDVAPDPEVVAQVRGRMKYTIEQVQLGTQNGGPAR